MIKQILEMIEAVDPSDTDGLRSIDCMVHCYIHNSEKEFCGVSSQKLFYRLKGETQHEQSVCMSLVPKFTRSRDALKSIRPDGWTYTSAQTVLYGDFSVWLSMGGTRLSSLMRPTEELAELHAILQAIEWNRNNG